MKMYIYLVSVAVLFVGCCNTKKITKEQTTIDKQETTETAETLTTFIDTKINENETLEYIKMEFYADCNVGNDFVGAGYARPECQEYPKHKLPQIKSIEILTKHKNTQTEQVVKQSATLNKKADTKTNIKYSKVTQVKNEPAKSNVKYWLLLFSLFICVLVFTRFRKWFNFKK